MLRKFKIKIDGKEYMVEMEEIGGVAAPSTVASPVTLEVAPTQSVPEVAVVDSPPTTTGDTSDAMVSPMPGAILKILVKVGDQVKENQPLLILEAMKMENEVVARQDGVITDIFVNQGQNVNAGEPLITVK
ncbi:acetyl-CoA carboxylase biotin carboxyl carrier protein subunit [Vagococcus zengguangii]|uniref:acetyl-CoA carboxylase biotin carboxyl carrier protein subunit n=1 Tax=Vagococcus zengguangii TaxID=2571750 RepID=UPI001107F82D|nr:acetyl-CoA carboxylase biotin carboxyl carrier protein subunit [Vagococcus zengguangii]TLG79440.1 acetyl-CoA carboxylase biotin carboxyl carrier protein subunit [Vagococcus zengguangii]